MRYLNHMNEDQAKALRDVRDGTMTLPKWRRTHELDGKRLARWLRNRYFRANLWAMLTEGRRIRELTIEMTANHAAQQVALAEAGKLRPGMAQVYRWDKAIEQARRQRTGKRTRARRQGRRVLEDRDLCHPDAKPREEELLAILRGTSSGKSSGKP